jgi:hypothetical protein
VIPGAARGRPGQLGRIAAGVLAYAARSEDPAVRELLALAEEAGAQLPEPPAHQAFEAPAYWWTRERG